MSGLATMTRYGLPGSEREEQYATRDMASRAIVVEDGSVFVNPRNMKLGEYYTAFVNGALYLYKRIGDTEIEVHELNEQI